MYKEINMIHALLLLVSIVNMANADDCTPEQLHLSLGEKYYNGSRVASSTGSSNQDLAKIIWVTHVTNETQDPCNSTFLQLSRADQTTEPVKLTPKVEKYTIEIPNVPNGNETKNYSRYANIVELNETYVGPETLYLVSVISANGTIELSSKFKIPSPIPTNYSLNVLFYADVDAGNADKNVSSTTYTRLKEELSKDDSEYNLTLLSGDIAYNIEDDFGQNGDNFLKAWQPLMSTRPLMLTPGNHDEFGNYSLLNYRFRMPLFEQSSNHYYSFNVGLVHFLSFDLDFYEEKIDAQSQEVMYKWVEKDLELANAPENRTRQPWIIIFSHRPIYCSYNDKDDQPTNRCYNFYEKRKDWDELFHKYNVDLYLSGHVHSYERMGPIYRNESQSYESSKNAEGVQIIGNPSSPIYILDGSPGNEYYMPNKTYEPLPYSMKTDIKVGFSALSIHNDSTIYMKHINSEDGSIIDHFYLKKDRNANPSPENHYLLPLIIIVSLLAVLGVGLVIIKSVKKPNTSKTNSLFENDTSMHDTSHFDKEIEDRGV